MILGAGPAGLCAALPLGDDALILERRDDIGGIAGSFEFHGVIFDMGGHSFHSPHPEVRNLVFNSLEMFEQTRDARCYAYGSLIPYPFQKYFHELKDPKVVAECEQGLSLSEGAADAANLESYLRRRFGVGLAEHFLLPYNRKQWGADLRRLSTDWVSERIAAARGNHERFETSGGKRKPLQDDTTVAYPSRGGFGEITKALARRVRNLRLATSVKRIDPLKNKIYTEAGEVLPWRRLVSTLPLNKLLEMSEHVPESLRLEISRLEHISLKLVFVVVGRPVETSIQRIYTAEPRIPAHKIVVASNCSDYLRSLPCHGFLGEVACAPHSHLNAKTTEDGFVTGLLELGLIKDAREIVATSSTDLGFAYPAPTMDRSAIVDRAKSWLEGHGIYSIGRFGEWAYINSDEAMFRGLAIAKRIAAEL